MSAATDRVAAVAVLARASALIDTPEKWTKKANARSRDGSHVYLDGERDLAVCFCADGALQAASFDLFGDDTGTEYRNAVRVLTNVMEVVYPHEFNDRLETTHADVMDAFTEATKVAIEEAATA